MDTYQYEFIPENRLQMDGHVDGNYQTSNNNNNNIPDQTNLNLSQRKVSEALTKSRLLIYVFLQHGVCTVTINI